MKRLLGVCALVVGCLGLLACLAGLVAVWLYRDPVEQAGLQGAQSAAEVLTVVEDRARGAARAVRGVRQAVEPAARTVLRLAEKGPDDPAQKEQLRATAEELRQQVRQVEALLEISRQAVDLINRSTGLARKAPWLAQALEDTTLSDLGPKAREGLDRMADLMETLDRALAEPGANKETRVAVARKLTTLAAEFADRTSDLQGRLDQLQSETAALRQRLATVQADLPGWTHRAAWLLTAILVWVGAGQGALMWLGRAMLRKSAKPADQGAPSA